MEKKKSLDYENDVRSPNHNIVLVQTVIPTQIPGNFNSRGGIAVTPSPAYLVENREFRVSSVSF